VRHYRRIRKLLIAPCDHFWEASDMDHRQSLDMDHRQTLQSGTVLDGKYRIERILGSGGFGITYQAYDVRLAATVAIKEYFPSQFGIRDATYSVRPRVEGDRDMFDRLRSSFLREARTLNQFDHPAIVRVFNVFEAYGTAYMVMKYESGSSLKAWLTGLARLPTQDELDRLTLPLLDALEMMHAAEFLHRDIAPDNIIVRPDGTPVLLDFGASRRVMGEMTGTLTGVVKKGYSPQEQYAVDGRSQGPWTDIYALGATLYRCVSNETPDEATQRMLEDKMLPAVDVGAGHYRRAFLAAIDAAIVLRPRGRPQSIAAWREMLFDGVVVTSGHPRSWPTAAGGGGPQHGEVTAINGPAHANSMPRSEPVTGGAASTRQPAAAASVEMRPSRSGWKMAALAAGLVAFIGGGALFAGWDQVDFGGTPAQILSQVFSDSSKTNETSRREAEEARQRQEQQIAQLTREAELRAAEEARQNKLAEEAEASRKANEVRERAAEEARRATEEARRAAEEEARKRQLAEAMEARRIAEEARKRAIEEGQQRAAEATRQRKLAEEAEARRVAAEKAQRRQEDEVNRLTREAAERASEATRRQIEEEASQRRLAEDVTQQRKSELAELRRKFEEAQQRASDASQLRAAEEARSRAAAEASAKEAKERTKIAALSKPPPPAPSGNVFDGRWSISYMAISPQCRSRANQFTITISNHRVSTRNGAGTGQVSSSGSIRWAAPGRFGPRPVDWTGTFRGNSGSGKYASRFGLCHGRFTAHRL
jgi:hypothetical protein